MSIVVKPTREAWAQYQRLEVLLQEEIRQYVAQAAENPMAELWLAPLPWPVDSLMLRFVSAVIDQVTVTPIFTNLDLAAGTMTLSTIEMTGQPSNDD